MRIKNLIEAQRALLSAATQSSGMPGTMVIERMNHLLNVIGAPQERLRVIHIAGTSGKTSTAYYISSLLLAAGKRVGLSVSPYTYALNDRLQLNGQPLTEPMFCEALEVFLALHEKVHVSLSYIELLTAFAYWQLERLGVDYAVIEANVGGIFDATNVAVRSDKIAVITDIGFDHVAILGHTLPEIAAKKAGIIHHGTQAFMLRQPSEVVETISSYARKQQATLTIIDRKPKVKLQSKLDKLPLFQQRNWWLAKQVYDYTARRDQLSILTAKKVEQTMQITIPGRMDKINYRNTPVILDVAHNPQKIGLLVESLKQLYPGQAAAVMVMIGDGKDAQSMLQALRTLNPYLICSEYIFTEGLPHQAYQASLLANIAHQLTIETIEVADNAAAFHLLLERDEPIKLVTGSLYGVSQIKALIDADLQARSYTP